MESSPVIRKLLPSADWIVARLMMPFSTTRLSTVRVSPSTTTSSVSVRYSINRTAMRRPMALRVARFIRSPPTESMVMLTCGWPFSSKACCALETLSPVTITSRSRRASRLGLSRNGNVSISADDASWRASRRNSRLAVAPSTRFAAAVSCTPGNSTMMRSAPWRCTRGSATPSSLTRLRMVVRFCSSA